LFVRLALRYELDVSLFSAADVSDGFLRELDTCLPVGSDNVAADVGVALSPLDHETVIAARSYCVLPDFGGA